MAREFRSGTGSATKSANGNNVTPGSQRRRLQISAAIAVLTCLAAPAKAQDATWLAAPGSNDFNTNTNWNPGTVPTGVAFFGASNITGLTLSANTTIGGWTFNAGAPAYTFTNTQTLTFNAAGIVNGSAATITNNAGAFVRFGNSSTAGTATFVNNGEMRFFDSSSGGNASFINNNLLNFQTQSSAGNAVITNNGLLEFVVRATGGNAAVTNSALAVVDFAHSLGPANDGALTIGSLAGGGNFYLGARRVTVGGNNLSTTVTGVISDCGASGVACGDPGATGGQLIKTGTGTLNLAGNNIYTGNTTVDAGTLLVNGSIASSALTTVNAGATLGGTGTVGNLTIAGGTLAPGNSIGTLSVQGSLVFTAAATYLIEISPTNSDLTNVTGSATLGGATVSAIYANGAYVARRYTIVNAAGGVNGTFGSVVNTNLPAGFVSSLSYDAQNAYLDLNLTFSPGFANGLNGNQTAVANALINSFNTTGGIPLVFGTLTPAGLTQVSGEAATGTQQTTFDAMDKFINVMTDPFMGTRAGGAPHTGATGYADENEAMAYAARKGRNAGEREAYAKMATKAPPLSFERRWSVWGAGYGGTQSTDGNAAVGSNSYTSRIYGGAAGLDYRVAPGTLVGFSLGGAGTKYDLVNGLGGGRSEMFQAGVYGRHDFGAAYLAGALAYGWQDVTTDRIALLNSYRAKFDANALSGRLEGGYRYAFGTSGLTPYAAGQFTTLWLPNYTEQVVAGVNTFALSYAERNVTAPRTELGLRADTSFAAADAVVTLRGRAAWAHNFNTDRSVSAIFQTLPASAFVVNGAAQARNSALVGASAEAKWLNGFSVAASFEGEFSDVTDSYAGKGIVRYQW